MTTEPALAPEPTCPVCGRRLVTGAAVAFARGGGLIRVAAAHPAARHLECASRRPRPETTTQEEEVEPWK